MYEETGLMLLSVFNFMSGFRLTITGNKKERKKFFKKVKKERREKNVK